MRNLAFLICTSMIFLAGCNTKAMLDQEIIISPTQKQYNAVEVKCGESEIEQLTQKIVEKWLDRRSVLMSNGMVVKCVAVDYNKGNQALRSFVGFGAGSAKLVMDVDFIDSEDNKTISKYTFEGVKRHGFFGGRSSETAKYIAKMIIENLKPYIKK